jgi:hypothetical protein
VITVHVCTAAAWPLLCCAAERGPGRPVRPPFRARIGPGSPAGRSSMSAGGGGDGGVSGDLEKEALRLQKLLALREEAARAHGAESPQCRNVARRYLQQREFVRTLLQKGRPIPVRTHARTWLAGGGGETVVAWWATPAPPLPICLAAPTRFYRRPLVRRPAQPRVVRPAGCRKPPARDRFCYGWAGVA